MSTQKPTIKPSMKPSTRPSSKPHAGHGDDLLDDLNNLTIRPATTQMPSSTKKPEHPPNPHEASKKPSSRPSPSQVPLPKTYAPQSFAPTFRPEIKATGPSKAPRLSVINELPSSRPSSSPHGQTQYAQATTLQHDKAQSRTPTQSSYAQATTLQRDKTQMPMNTTLQRDPTKRPPTGYPSQSTLSQASSMEKIVGMSQGGQSIMQSIMKSHAPPDVKSVLTSQRDLEMAGRQTKITTMNQEQAKEQHEWYFFPSSHTRRLLPIIPKIPNLPYSRSVC